jgi:outer membrane protein OmpA-like peptidoglycan-associated protein
MSSSHSQKDNGHLEESIDNSTNGFRLLLPALLLMLVAAAAWYFMGKAVTPVDPHAATEAHGEGTTHEAASHETHTATPVAAGTVDSLGNFIYDNGALVTLDLPNNGGKLEVGQHSTESKLYAFLKDASQKIDTVKGNWFEFTNVKFVSGGAQIDSASLLQLKNVAAIVKSFSTAQFKIGGYTDNSGDSAKNVALSQKRADVVLAELKKLGATAGALVGSKGYGPEHPIGDNSTKEGKAMNRRVAVNVKAK